MVSFSLDVSFRVTVKFNMRHKELSIVGKKISCSYLTLRSVVFT